MLRSPRSKQPSAWFTLGALNIKSPNKFPSNHRIKFPQITDFFLKTFAYFNYFYYLCAFIQDGIDSRWTVCIPT